MSYYGWCFICGKKKEFSSVSTYVCKDCNKLQSKEYYNYLKTERPDKLALQTICGRCKNDKHYSEKNIRCFLTLQDVKYLWQRDNAASMTTPSIHRLDSNKNYTLENCQVIEWAEHKKLHYPALIQGYNARKEKMRNPDVSGA